MKKLFIIHEGHESLMPLMDALDGQGLPYEPWMIHKLDLDLSSVPPQGVYLNCIGCSAYKRENNLAIEIAGTVLAWLKSHNRSIVNGRRALQLELRKSELYGALYQSGIKTPKTIAVNHIKFLEKAARKIEKTPFIVRPNRCTCQKNIYLIRDYNHLEMLVKNEQLTPSPDGIWLVQEYIESMDRSVIRLEFIGGKFYYAVRTFESRGYPIKREFNLDPPISTALGIGPKKSEDEIIKEYKDGDLDVYRRFFEDNKIDIGSIEYILDKKGNKYVYNFTTEFHYNRGLEIFSRNGYSGYDRLAEFLYGVMESRQILSAWAKARQVTQESQSRSDIYSSAS